MRSQNRSARSILFVHSSDDSYGSDRVIYLAARTASAMGLEITLVLPDDTEPGWLSDRFTELGAKVVRVPLAVARRRYLRFPAIVIYPFRVVIAGRRLRRLMRHERPDLIHIGSSVLLSCLALRGCASKVIWHIQEITRRPAPLRALLSTAPLYVATDIVVPSRAVHDFMAKARTATRRHIIPNAHSQSTPRREEDIDLLFVGRMSSIKGYDVFIDAVEIMSRTRHVDVVMAGGTVPGEEWRLAELRDRVAALGDRARVRVLGQVENTAQLYSSARIVVVPSRVPEAFGMVALEAMAAGAVVIGSDIGALPELIEHGSSGILVNPDSPEEIAAAAARLLDDNEERASLSDRGRTIAHSLFSVERMAEALRPVYGLQLSGIPHEGRS